MTKAVSQQFCRFCNTPLTETFADLGMSPSANHYRRPDKMDSAEAFFPLHARVCSSCHLVQVGSYQTPEDLFSDYAYFSSFASSWLAHMERYAETMTERLGLGSDSLVVEVASNDGYLLQYFKERDVPVLGIEPAANVAETARAKGIESRVEFFGIESGQRLKDEGRQADLLIGNNVLAHVPDLNDFVGGLKRALKPTGLLTMEFPHLHKLIELNQFDTIYHEHFSYFSALTLVKVFAAHGLMLVDVDELPTHGGSLRIHVVHDDSERAAAGQSEALNGVIAREKAAGLDQIETYRDFAEKVRATKRGLLKFLIAAKTEGKTVVGYGAPAKGNTLLNYCGVRTDFLEYTVDRSPHKQGHALPGVGIPIYAPERIFQTKPDFVLILPWNLKDEIMKDMAGIAAWGGRFVTPIPEVTVYPTTSS
ncbi:MAG: class I SAM-dependent methyltransferase [Pseudomonadota bacterium]